MKPTPLAEILRRIRPLAPIHQAYHLRAVISLEPRRSIRRRELEAALKTVMCKQLKRENRSHA
jgi:hypothetical protein